jgi:hypothetical protein
VLLEISFAAQDEQMFMIVARLRVVEKRLAHLQLHEGIRRLLRTCRYSIPLLVESVQNACLNCQCEATMHILSVYQHLSDSSYPPEWVWGPFPVQRDKITLVMGGFRGQQVCTPYSYT